MQRATAKSNTIYFWYKSAQIVSYTVICKLFAQILIQKTELVYGAKTSKKHFSEV